MLAFSLHPPLDDPFLHSGIAWEERWVRGPHNPPDCVQQGSPPYPTPPPPLQKRWDLSFELIIVSPDDLDGA